MSDVMLFKTLRRLGLPRQREAEFRVPQGHGGRAPRNWRAILEGIAVGFAAGVLVLAVGVITRPAPAPAGPPRFGDGVWTVRATGGDMTPGVYATRGQPGAECRWWLTDVADPGRLVVLPQSQIEDTTPAAIRFPVADLHTSGCGDWTAVP